MEPPLAIGATAINMVGTPDLKCASPLRLVEHHDGVVVNSDQRPAAVMNTGGLTPVKAPKPRKRNTASQTTTNVVRGFHTPSSVSTDHNPDMPPANGYSMSRQTSNSNGYAMSRQASNSNGYAMSRQSSNSSGIAMLKNKLDALALSESLDKSPQLLRHNSMGADSNASFCSSVASEGELETYQVALEHDFVSPELCPKHDGRMTPVEGGLSKSSTLFRKMAAKDFRPLKCLGSGAFGTVHLVKHRETGRLFAQKQFRKASLTVHKRLVDQTRTERSILESVNQHPFVVKLYYAFQDHEKLYLILEYAQGGELFTHLAMERMFSEDVAAFYVAEMVLALEHLHTNVRVVYRDLKPENCLLDAEGHLLLTDFGLSKEAVDDSDSTPCQSFLGTIEYMAPEVITGTKYGMAVDYWSLGAICFDLLTGSPPFQGASHTKIQQNILKQKLQLPYFLGPDAKDFLTRLLRKEPGKRLGAHMPRDMKVIKGHRFFRKIDWKKLNARQLEPPIRPLITDPELAENFAKEFTELPCSSTQSSFSEPEPTDAERAGSGIEIEGCEGSKETGVDSNPFGGFSFVASRSLLERDHGLLA